MNCLGKRFVPFRDEVGLKNYYGVYDDILGRQELVNIGEDLSKEIADELNAQVDEPEGKETSQFKRAVKIFEQKSGRSYW
jgi:hypothetical protein